jgi:hypothetical protein
MPFAFLYSRKNKVFTPEEQNTIDKICRDLGKYTKKEFTITMNVEEDRSYGGSETVGGNWLTRETRTFQNRVTQVITYNYTFPKSEFYLSVRKVFATNGKESKEMLNNSRNWDHYAAWSLQDPALLPKWFKAKDISGVIMFSGAKIDNKNKFNFYDFGYAYDDIFSCTLLSYNSKWPQQIEKQLVKFFEKVTIEAK